MSVGRCAAVSLLILLMGNRAAQAQPFSASYDQKVTRGAEVSTSKVLVKNTMFRIESTMEGERNIIIRNQDGLYTYAPAEGTAVKLEGLEPSLVAAETLGDYAGYLHQRGAARIDSDIVNGRLCDVYQFTDPATRSQATAWVWQDKQFPLKVELDGPDGITVVELSNIQLDVVPSDTAFQLPSDIKLMDVDSLINAEDDAGEESHGSDEPALKIEYQ